MAVEPGGMNLWQAILSEEPIGPLLKLLPQLSPEHRKALFVEVVDTLERLGEAGLGTLPLESVELWGQNLRIIGLSCCDMGDDEAKSAIDEAFEDLEDLLEDEKAERAERSRPARPPRPAERAAVAGRPFSGGTRQAPASGQQEGLSVLPRRRVKQSAPEPEEDDVLGGLLRRVFLG